MGDINQSRFVEKNKKLIIGPILEIGAKDYGSTENLRKFFPHETYVPVDIEAGTGVDIVVDLTLNIDIIRKKLPVKKFKTIISFSVLEHCSNPFIMAENIMNLLDDDGMVFISVPFIWHVHAYPSDYWRFTPEGIKILFPNLDFDIHVGNASTITGEVSPISKKLFNIYSGHSSLH